MGTLEGSTSSVGTLQTETVDKEQVFEWILDLSDSSKREQALLELRWLDFSVSFENKNSPMVAIYSG